MKNLNLAFLLVLMSQVGWSQQLPKTIFEMYEIPAEACSFVGSGEAAMSDTEVAIEMPPPPPPPAPVPEAAEADLTWQNAIAVFQKYLQDTKFELSVAKVRLVNGNACFFEGGLWGLENAKGKGLQKPRFEHVVADTLAGGFVGYQSGKGNYYDAGSGTPQLSQEFYYVEAVQKDVFIVQTDAGFGLVSRKQQLLPPIYSKLKANRNLSRLYFSASNANGQSLVILDAFRTQIPMSEWENPSYIDSKIFVDKYNVYDLKSKQKLICTKGFSVQTIDGKNQVFGIKRGRENYFVLANAKGVILADQLYMDLGKRNQRGLGVAAIKSTRPGASSREKQYGLLNAKNEWATPPIYRNVFQAFQSDCWYVKSPENKTGLLDAAGKVLLEAEYDLIYVIDAQRVLVGSKNQEGQMESTIRSIASGEILVDGLDYTEMVHYQHCGENNYSASNAAGKAIVTGDLKQLVPPHSQVFFHGDYFQAANFGNGGGKRSKKLYTCDGQPVAFKLDGKKISDFEETKVVSSDLLYLRTHEGQGYLMPASGKAKPIGVAVQFAKSLGDKQLYVLTANNFKNAGIVNALGETVLPFDLKGLGVNGETRKIITFHTDLDKIGMLNMDGVAIVPPKYDLIKHLGFDLYVASRGKGKNRKSGLLNGEGQLLLPLQEKRISLVGGLVQLQGNNETALYDRAGKPL